MEYDDLLLLCDTEGLMVKEKPLRTYDGRIKGRKIFIRSGMTVTEKKCVLAEELGHYYTTVGNILDQSNSSNRKQERKARIMAYNKMIGLVGLISAFKAGCRSRFDTAEYLGVTEPFLEDALDYYRSKFGLCTKVDNYIVYFEPVGILELF